MTSQQIAHFIADALADKKATDITILDVHDLVGYTDVFVVCTGRSDRLVKALAEHVERMVRTELRLHPIGVEGVERGVWALIDLGDVVVHIFREHERVFYDLEGLWEDAPRVPYEPPIPTAATGT